MPATWRGQRHRRNTRQPFDIASEAMAALGVPSTRALAAVTTGQQVRRETSLPGAVLARVAASHIRVGTFQYIAALGDTEALRRLADYVVARPTTPRPRQLSNPIVPYWILDAVVARQADLVARWMLIGLIHGVMNTDNTSISGETIDYGPCSFMDAYNPATMFSSIDNLGRYAYGNQPNIALWNLASDRKAARMCQRVCGRIRRRVACYSAVGNIGDTRRLEE
jgi:uncharacterized protein YdiU (UPF0061 family)